MLIAFNSPLYPFASLYITYLYETLAPVRLKILETDIIMIKISESKRHFTTVMEFPEIGYCLEGKHSSLIHDSFRFSSFRFVSIFLPDAGDGAFAEPEGDYSNGEGNEPFRCIDPLNDHLGDSGGEDHRYNRPGGFSEDISYIHNNSFSAINRAERRFLGGKSSFAIYPHIIDR